MVVKLTDALVKALETPEKGQSILFDSEVKGFGIRVTAGGVKAYILDYRTKAGLQRRYTIGGTGSWKLAAAREEAGDLRKVVDKGGDPMGDVREKRTAPTIGDLCDRYIADELPKRRATTARGYATAIEKDIRPLLGKVKVAEVTHADVDRLHRRVTSRGKPIQANRVVATFSKMLTLSAKWGWRPDNPAKGIERNGENKRERYASPSEIAALSAALDAHPDQTFANIIRIALLTGARRGEVQQMKWAGLDLNSGTWTKPAATTKQKKVHRVPLAPAVVELLTGLHAAAISARKDRRRAGDIAPHASDNYVFTVDGKPYIRDQRKAWAAICKAAGLDDFHVHDTRHTFASLLASSGASLLIIGSMLGHTQAQTTQRYSHLMDDSLRVAAATVAAAVTKAKAGGVIDKL